MWTKAAILLAVVSGVLFFIDSENALRMLYFAIIVFLLGRVLDIVI